MSGLKKYGGFIVLVLVVIGMILLSLKPGLTASLFGFSVGIEISGFQAVFGYQDELLNIELSTIGVVAFFLAIIGAVIAIIPVGKPVTSIISALALFVGSIMLFFVPGSHGEGVSLGVGLTMPAILILLAALFQVVLIILEKVKK